MPNTSSVRVAFTRSGAWTEITETVPSMSVVRIRATDLRLGQQACARVRAETVQSGRTVDTVAVFLDIEFHIADDARTARAEFAALVTPAAADSITYVGTANGLAGLVADVKAAHVADGVTLIPAGFVQRNLTAVAERVVPHLASGGVVFQAAAQLIVKSANTLAS